MESQSVSISRSKISDRISFSIFRLIRTEIRFTRLFISRLTPDETIRECLQRAVLNNCSILLEDCSLLKVFSGPDLNYLSEDSARVVPIYMLFFPKRIRGSLRTKPRDGSEIRFFAPWNIPLDQVFPPMRRVIQYFVDNHSSMPIAQSADWDRYPEIVE